ncbi:MULTISPECIES: hypothetical protein [Burkholderia]|nr:MULTISPECIES: hypothetical protein [Burkholderia]
MRNAGRGRLARRGAERGDPGDILAWLGNHFFRRVVWAFEYAQPLDSLAE